MRIKDALIELNGTYGAMRKEALHTLQAIRPKLKSISDADQMQEFIERKYFYWKEDLLSIAELANKYNVSITRLKKSWDRYAFLEKQIDKSKPAFKKLKLGRFEFSPYALNVSGSNADVSIFIDKGKLDMGIYPKKDLWTKAFSQYARNLKKEIKIILEAKL